MADRQRRWPFWLRKALGVLAVLFVTVAVLPGSSRAEEPVSFGMESRGSATGLHVIVNRTGTAPLEPMVGVLLGTARGELNEHTGVTATAASSMYPGDAIESPKGVFALVGLPVAGNLLPPGHPLRAIYDAVPEFIPNYPLVTNASYPGPQGKRVDMFGEALALAPSVYPMEVRGMVQEAAAADGYASSKATVGSFVLGNPLGLVPETGAAVEQLAKLVRPFADAAPASGPLLTVRGLESSYEALKSSGEGQATTTTRVSDVRILGGLVELGDVRSIAVQVGGAKGSKVVDGGSEIGFAKVLGIRGSFGDQGFELADNRIPADKAAAVTELLRQVLERIGLTVTTVSRDQEGSRFTTESFSVSFKAQEPPVPALSMIGRESMIILRFGGLESELSTFSSGGDTFARDEVAGPGVAPSASVVDDPSLKRGSPSMGYESSAGTIGTGSDDHRETTGHYPPGGGRGAPSVPPLPTAGPDAAAFSGPTNSDTRTGPGPGRGGTPDAVLQTRRASELTGVSGEFADFAARLALLGFAGFGAALFVWRRRSMPAH